MQPSHLAGIVNLDHPGHYIHFHWLLISYGNAIVIGLMVATFVTALFLPFPGSRRDSHRDE
jgi:hypothetical protein